MREQIIRGMALAFFAVAWRQQKLEQGIKITHELSDDEVPDEIDKSAMQAAITLYMDFKVRLSAISIDLDTYELEMTERKFGCFVALHSMDKKPNLLAFVTNDEIADCVPSMLFDSASLSKDY